jgi:hypothetical protein
LCGRWLDRTGAEAPFASVVCRFTAVACVPCALDDPHLCVCCVVPLSVTPWLHSVAGSTQWSTVTASPPPSTLPVVCCQSYYAEACGESTHRHLASLAGGGLVPTATPGVDDRQYTPAGCGPLRWQCGGRVFVGKRPHAQLSVGPAVAACRGGRVHAVIAWRRCCSCSLRWDPQGGQEEGWCLGCNPRRRSC